MRSKIHTWRRSPEAFSLPRPSGGRRQLFLAAPFQYYATKIHHSVLPAHTLGVQHRRWATKRGTAGGGAAANHNRHACIRTYTPTPTPPTPSPPPATPQRVDEPLQSPRQSPSPRKQQQPPKHSLCAPLHAYPCTPLTSFSTHQLLHGKLAHTTRGPSTAEQSSTERRAHSPTYAR